MIILNPYLSFIDKAEEVLGFYKSVFGGTVEISRFGDMASQAMPVKDEHKDLVMHGVLKNDVLQLMVSDTAPNGESEGGSSISLSLSGDDAETLTTYYNGLNQDATILQPLEKAPWGDTFGMLTDKYGITWMVNIAAA
ncbi:MAG TPA: VOC family protein [Candidatus Saccharimonadales bacterium]|nr:VOC family protein [Candidatus Saccharimonadales bacterium]